MMMASSPLVALTEANSKVYPRSSKDLVNGIHYTRESTAEADDRSSSLSEIGDRVGNDDLVSSRSRLPNGSDPEDTEAETERLEESPQKPRKNQNVVMTSTTHIFSNGTSPLSDHPLPIDGANADLAGDRTDPLSDISSLADSGDENGKSSTSLGPSPKKRKRSTVENDEVGGVESEATSKVETSPQVSEYFGRPTADKEPSNAYAVEEPISRLGSATLPASEKEGPNAQRFLSAKQKSKKGKRKGKKIKDEASLTSTVGPEIENILDIGITVELESAQSIAEEVEMEEAGEDGEMDLVARNEEASHITKSAMESLLALEKCFLSLRSKLFDERLAQTEEELAMLAEPIPAHPEVAAQMKVVDRRYDDKVEYKKTWLRFQLNSLQRKSVAEKAQAHSQFMQTARDVRERSLEKLSKESYQLQRERRNTELDPQAYCYNFSTRRSVQITNQTAYNQEVSILSGVAKYVGFPAAPELSALKPREIEEDLVAMGIAEAPTASSEVPNPPAQLARTSLPATTPRFPVLHKLAAAEEQFLEQNPWANAQHPAHNQHPQHPQHPQHHNHTSQSNASGISADTMVANPVSQRQIVDLAASQSSASNIIDASNRPGFDPRDYDESGKFRTFRTPNVLHPIW